MRVTPPAPPLSVTIRRSPSDDPREVAERLVEAMVEVGADALNLRVQLPGMAPEQVREQIERLGSTVVPLVKQALWSAERNGGRHASGSASIRSRGGSHRPRRG